MSTTGQATPTTAAEARAEAAAASNARLEREKWQRLNFTELSVRGSMVAWSRQNRPWALSDIVAELARISELSAQKRGAHPLAARLTVLVLEISANHPGEFALLTAAQTLRELELELEFQLWCAGCPAGSSSSGYR
jgi:hypothetical protein